GNRSSDAGGVCKATQTNRGGIECDSGREVPAARRSVLCVSGCFRALEWAARDGQGHDRTRDPAAGKGAGGAGRRRRVWSAWLLENFLCNIARANGRRRAAG